MLFIEAKAVGKERPRFSKISKCAYTPSKTKEFERLVKSHARYYMKFKNREMCCAKTPVSMNLTIHRKVPDSWSEKRKMDAINGVIRPTVTPDFDNIIKAVTDALQGVFFEDDKQVVEFHYYDWYGSYDTIETDFKEIK